ncbi:MAG: hypothetical protein U0354_20650 [Candidatus Sericytochromatia bacterium]
MKKVSIVSLIVLSSVSITACGNTANGVLPIPVKMTRVSVDSGCNCTGVRPTVKLQATMPEDIKTASTIIPPKVNASSTLSTKTIVKSTTDTKKSELDLGSELPEVKAPPSSSTGSGSSVQQPETKKTKFGQLVDKVKNLFKKKD